HQLDGRIRAAAITETDLVAHPVAQLGVELFGNALGHRRRSETPGLSVRNHALSAPAQLKADLGKLGRLARTGLPAHDHHLILLHRPGDRIAMLADRQIFWIADRRWFAVDSGPGLGNGAVSRTAAVVFGGFLWVFRQRDSLLHESGWVRIVHHYNFPLCLAV